MNERPYVGTAAIIKKNGKVLLGKRKNAAGAGEWCFPGGHLEYKEDIKTCVKREVLEEAGIRIKNIKFYSFTNDIRNDTYNTHYVTLFFSADYKSGKVTLMEPQKCEGWDWFSWDNLPRPLFLPIKNLLKQKINPFQ